VLRAFNKDERAALPSLITDAADAVELIASDGLPAAQLRFHTVDK
jgi:PTH1 family peptidyl-tRNA hydrolase